MNNIIRTWNQRAIRQRKDGYFSATDMCQACDKRFYNWERTDSAKEYLKALQGKRYSDVSNGNLVDIIQGGTPEEQGTWVYRKVAIRLAQWLSAEFAVQVDEWTDDLMTNGHVELQPQLQLPPADIRVHNLVSSLDKLGLDFSNPRFKQGYQDLAHDILGLGQPKLPGTPEVWLGVAERAEQLGYSVTLVSKNRSQLGKFVKAHNLEATSEKRLCNGTQRDINLYRLTDELDEAIKEFMDAKVLAT